MDLWKKCIDKMEQTIKFTKIDKKDIDEIILVGKSTRIPKIKEIVKDYFNGKEPLENINPDNCCI